MPKGVGYPTKKKRTKLGGGFVAPVAEPASAITPAERAALRKGFKADRKAKRKAKRSRIKDSDF